MTCGGKGVSLISGVRNGAKKAGEEAETRARLTVILWLETDK